MKKKTLYTIVGIAVLLIIVLLIGKQAGWFGSSGNFKQVDTAIVERVDIIETVAATGKIQPEIEVMLSSEVSGEIIELPVREGQLVERGDLLVRINPDIYQSSLKRSEAGLQNMRAPCPRPRQVCGKPNSITSGIRAFLKKELYHVQNGSKLFPATKWLRP